HPAACHCGAVRLSVRLTDGLKTARRCDCSLCRMRGAVAVSAPLDGLEVVAGRDALRLYQFNTKVAEHWFCGICGIYTHHRRRSDPNEYGVNVACLEGVSPFDFPEVEVNNGQRHPSDDADAPEIVGVFRFTAADPAGTP
ncbi:MAG: GFA family protein, partial [Pseudomonadota bacterium]